MADDLFSAGFAWDSVADDATPAATPEKQQHAALAHTMSHPPATPVATVDAATFSGDFGWSDDDVASVADVATGHHEASMSQSSGLPPATPFATPKTADFRAFNQQITPPVADVASVANWSAAIDRADRRGCPPNMADAAWRRLLMDARMTVQNWGMDLIALGWTTLDVFSAPRRPEHRRIDVAGLVLMLRGRSVEAIDRDTALIRATPRDAMTFQRTLIAAGGVPFWEWATGSGAVGMAGGGSAPSAYPPSPRHVNPDEGEG